MTIGFLFGAALLVVLFLALLLPPLLRPPSTSTSTMAPRDDAAAASLRARLDEIAADARAGLLSEDAAEEATREAKRDALAAVSAGGALEKAGSGKAGSGKAGAAPRLRLATVAAVLLAPLLGAFVYAKVGAPAQRAAIVAATPPTPADAAAIADLDPDARRAAIENMVGGLAARLEANADDLNGWRMLARSQAVLGRFDASIESYARVVELSDGALDDLRALANAHVARVTAAGGDGFPESAEFEAVLDAIEASAPDDPFALYYRGGLERARGEPARAAAAWRRLLDGMPADEPARATLEGLIAEVEAG